jgi:4-amino-4-deoxy-L-arabinose transferase-like glycosyltransferase
MRRVATLLTRPLVFDGRATPVKTLLFHLICAAWILPGLVGHDPWKPDEALTFGVVLDMLTKGSWFAPAIAGQMHVEYPPFYAWVAACLAKLLTPLLPLHDGARLATGLFMALTIWYVRKTAARLNDERAGRIGVLLLIGCLGLFLRGHEMNPEVAGLAGFAMALYGLSRMRSESGKTGWHLGLGSGLIALSIGIVPALIPFLIAGATLWGLREGGNRTAWRGLGKAMLLAVPAGSAFPMLLWVEGQPVHAWQAAIWGLPFAEGRRGADLTYFLTLLPWYALPALPLALWVWWKDRALIRERLDVALPLAAFVIALLALSLVRKGNDAVAMWLLIPLALAGAGAPDRLPRGLARFVDWFGLMFFGLLVIALWLYWTAAVTGFPAGAARAVARQAPGYVFEVAWFAVLLAAMLTLVWAYAVGFAHRNNRRAIVNWSAGVTILWVLPNLLALGALDHVRSYRGVSAQLVAAMPRDHAGACVAQVGLGDAQRALLHYFGGLVFAAPDAGCRLLLTQGTRERSPTVGARWALIWEGARPGDQTERLRLYRARPDG